MSPRVKSYLLGAVFLAIVILAYSNHFDNGFQFDDSHTIVNNQAIRELANVPRFFTDGTTSSSLPANQSYRPLSTTLNAIDYWLAGGLDPFYFHFSLFFWYLVQLVLIFVLFRRILDLSFEHRLNPLIALFTTAFYGLHTANAETVNYICARTDSFSTLCVVASLVLYQYPKTRKLHLYLLTLILGIYTKQTGVMAAALLFLYIALFEEKLFDASVGGGSELKKLTRSATRCAPALAVAVFLFLFNQFFMTPSTTVSSNTGVSRIDYLLTQCYVVTHYLGNFLLPLELSADPDFRLITTWVDVRVIYGLAVVIGLLVVSVALAKKPRTRPISYGILWFFIALLPTSSFVPLFQIANDHRTFFPYIGLSLSVGWAVGLWVIQREESGRRGLLPRLVIPALLLLVLAGHVYGVRQRNQVWSSSEALWRDVTQKSPENGRGHLNYGLSQMEKGNYSAALKSYQRSLELWPVYPYTHTNLGILKDATGQPDAAEQHFKDGLRHGPANPPSYYHYAKFLAKHERREEALKLLQKGRRLSPEHVGIRALLSELKARTDPRAHLALQLAKVQDEPTVANYIDLSLAHYEVGEYEESITVSQRVLELEPRSALAYNNICAASNHLEQWEKGIEACQKALAIRPDFRRAKANLRWALKGRTE